MAINLLGFTDSGDFCKVRKESHHESAVTAADKAALLEALGGVQFATVTVAAGALSTGDNKALWRAPFACTITDVRASVQTASSSGAVQFDIRNGANSLFTTALTIDQGDKSSVDATTPYAFDAEQVELGDDDELVFDIDDDGTDTAGLQITLYFRQA